MVEEREGKRQLKQLRGRKTLGVGIFEKRHGEAGCVKAHSQTAHALTKGTGEPRRRPHSLNPERTKKQLLPRGQIPQVRNLSRQAGSHS